jgi:hypothetical protein
VHDNHVGIPISKVTNPLAHLHHFLPIWGLGLVKLTHIRPFGVVQFVHNEVIRIIT